MFILLPKVNTFLMQQIRIIIFNFLGEVTFKALLYVPKVLSSNSFQEYGKTHDNIKVL